MKNRAEFLKDTQLFLGVSEDEILSRPVHNREDASDRFMAQIERAVHLQINNDLGRGGPSHEEDEQGEEKKSGTLLHRERERRKESKIVGRSSN